MTNKWLQQLLLLPSQLGVRSRDANSTAHDMKDIQIMESFGNLEKMPQKSTCVESLRIANNN